jgi:hypothetical protein
VTGNKENKVWCRSERSQEMLLPSSQGLVTSRDYLFRCRGEARIGSGTMLCKNPDDHGLLFPFRNNLVPTGSFPKKRVSRRCRN